MASFRSTAWSSIGKKVVTGVTGFLLFGFVCVHLLGNLTLLIPDHGKSFNEYAHFLEGLLHGWFLVAAEVGLIAAFLFHIVAGITVAWIDKRNARPEKYAVVKNAGGASRKGLASRGMIVTGLVLLVYVPVHVWMFKFAERESVTYHGVTMGNLHEVVVEAFQNPAIALSYVAVMAILGVHLWHGFWSAFQSLGLTNDKYLPLIEGLGKVFAILLAVGFLLLPLYFLLLSPGPEEIPYPEGKRSAEVGRPAKPPAPDPAAGGR